LNNFSLLKIGFAIIITTLVGFSLTAKPTNVSLDDLYCGTDPVMLERGRANELAAIVEKYIHEFKITGGLLKYSLNSFITAGAQTENLQDKIEVPFTDFSYDDSIGLTPEVLEEDGSVLATAQFFSEALPSNESGHADLKCYIKIFNQRSFCDPAAPLVGKVETCEIIPEVESLPSVFSEELSF
jgi:hypothetical protein